MDPRAGRLADQKQLGLRCAADDWTRAERQRIRTNRAGPHSSEQRLEVFGHSYPRV